MSVQERMKMYMATGAFGGSDIHSLTVGHVIKYPLCLLEKL